MLLFIELPSVGVVYILVVANTDVWQINVVVCGRVCCMVCSACAVGVCVARFIQ